MATVKSLGAEVSCGAKGTTPEASIHSAMTLGAPGLCAMLIAAVAVSMGLTPLMVPVLVARAKRAVQATEEELAVLAESTQAARMLPRVSSSAWGTTAPLPATVVWLAMS